MSQFSNDDHELVAFLKQHRSPVPPPSAAAEDQLFALIDATPSVKAPVAFQRSRQTRRSVVWLMPPAIAAGLIATLVSYRTLVPAKPSTTEIAGLETFIESNWQGTFSNNSSDDDAMLLSEGTTN